MVADDRAVCEKRRRVRFMAKWRNGERRVLHASERCGKNGKTRMLCLLHFVQSGDALFREAAQDEQYDFNDRRSSALVASDKA